MDAPGAVFAAALDGEIVEEGVVGLASLELGVPLTAESVLNAGSIAKWLTAYAVLRLAEEGRLSLDGTVGAYLDGWPEPVRELTVAQLLQHTSGLRDYWSPGWRRRTGAAATRAAHARPFAVSR